jgi:hypothetical protein
MQSSFLPSGSQLVTNCHQLKLTAADGKERLGTVESATSSDLYVKVPSGSDCTIGVYVGGNFSNFFPFNYE